MTERRGEVKDNDRTDRRNQGGKIKEKTKAGEKRESWCVCGATEAACGILVPFTILA